MPTRSVTAELMDSPMPGSIFSMCIDILHLINYYKLLFFLFVNVRKYDAILAELSTLRNGWFRPRLLRIIFIISGKLFRIKTKFLLEA